jgi:hypothetical protein
MMRRFTNSFLVLVGCLMLSIPCLAQESDDLELNLFVAGTAYTKNRFDIAYPQSATPLPGTFAFDNAIRGGIRVNVYNGGHWGEEFFYSYEPNQATIRRTVGTSVSQTKLDIQMHNFGINALYFLSADEERRIRPFLSFGVGGTVYRPTQEARQAAVDPNRANLPGFGQSNEFALNYGVGLKSRVNNRVGFRMDVKGFLGRNPSFSLPRDSPDPRATVFPASGAIHSLEASAGLIFYLGR